MKKSGQKKEGDKKQKITVKINNFKILVDMLCFK